MIFNFKKAVIFVFVFALIWGKASTVVHANDNINIDTSEDTETYELEITETEVPETSELEITETEVPETSELEITETDVPETSELEITETDVPETSEPEITETDVETNASIETSVENDNNVEILTKIKNHDITWEFITYNEPNFMAEKVGKFIPQTVSVLETNENGWALININKGAYWVYLDKNQFFLDKSVSIYDNIESEDSIGIVSPQIISIIDQKEEWLLIETWLGEKWINLSYIRPYVILDVPAFNQRGLGYPTGCEIVSLGMMINYENKIDIKTLVSEMPRNSNPNLGFRGNPSTKAGFTIFPSALMELTEKYLASSHDMSGNSMDDLKEKLNSNIPIVVWVNGLGFNVHAVCLSGYNDNGFYYNDPWTGKKNSFIDYNSFYKIWNKPIYDKQLKTTYSTRKAISYYPIV